MGIRVRRVADWVRLLIAVGLLALPIVAAAQPAVPGAPVGQLAASGLNPVTFTWAADDLSTAALDYFEAQVSTTTTLATDAPPDIAKALRPSPDLTLHVPAPALLYCRVRAFDPQGLASAWSAWSPPLVVPSPQIEMQVVDDIASTWTNSTEIRVSLRNQFLAPAWIELADNPEFTSATRVTDLTTAMPLVRRYIASTRRPTSFALSPDARKLYMSALSPTPGIQWSTLQVYDFPSGELLQESEQAIAASAIAVHPSEPVIALGDDDQVALHSANDLTQTTVTTLAAGTLLLIKMQFQSGGNMLAYSVFPDGLSLVHGTTMKPAAVPRNTLDAPYFDFSPAGNWMITLGGTSGNQYRRLNIATGVMSAELPMDAGLVQVTPDEQGYVGRDSLYHPVLYAARNQRLLMQAPSLGDYSSMTVSPDGSLLCFCAGGQTSIFDLQTGRLLRKPSGIGPYAEQLRSPFIIPPDGQQVLAINGLYELRVSHDIKLGALADGAQVIYARSAGAANVTSMTVLVDRTGPIAAAPQLTTRAQDGRAYVDMTCPSASDNEPGSGVASYNWAFSMIGPQFGTLHLVPGQHGPVCSTDARLGRSYTARVRAMDQAGNLGPWSERSEAFQVTWPFAPNVERAEVYGSDERFVNQASTSTLRVALEGLSNAPSWVEIAENEQFSSVERIALDSWPPFLLSQFTESPLADWAMSVDGGRLLMMHEGYANLWNLRTGTFQQSITTTDSLTPSAYPLGNAMRTQAFDDSGRYLIARQGPNTPFIFDLQTSQRLTIGQDACYTQVWRPHSLQFAAVGTDLRTRLYDASSGQLLRTFDSSGPPANFTVPQAAFVTFTADGERMLTHLRNSVDTGCLWDVETGALIKRFPRVLGIYGYLKQISLSADGRRVYFKHFSDYDGLSTMLSADWSWEEQSVPGAKSYQTSDDPNWMLVDWGTSATLYDQHTGQLLGRFPPAEGAEITMGLSRDGRVACFQKWVPTDPASPPYISAYDARPSCRYTLRDATPGRRAVWVRVGNAAGVSEPVRVEFELQGSANGSQASNTLAYLLGLAPQSVARDANEDGVIDAADLITENLPVLAIAPDTAQREFAPGEALPVRWSRNYRAGTALRVELWRDGARVALLGEIHSTDYTGEATFEMPALAGGPLRLRIVSAWLEGNGGATPYAEAEAELHLVLP